MTMNRYDVMIALLDLIAIIAIIVFSCKFALTLREWYREARARMRQVRALHTLDHARFPLLKRGELDAFRLLTEAEHRVLREDK
jgi:hypothetical protein